MLSRLLILAGLAVQFSFSVVDLVSSSNGEDSLVICMDCDEKESESKKEKDVEDTDKISENSKNTMTVFNVSLASLGNYYIPIYASNYLNRVTPPPEISFLS